MSTPELEAFFAPGTAGKLFSLLYCPPANTTVRGAVMYLAPFGEEMNKGRRMAALQARAWANAGWFVLQQDSFGCGDSEGEFADATWAVWLADALRAAHWLKARTGHRPVLWGARAGALLACAMAQQEALLRQLLFWHPVTSGKLLLQQLLRLKVAGNLFAAESGGASTRQWRMHWETGQSVEIAGYEWSSALALAIEARALVAPASVGQLAWLELSGSHAHDLSPAAQAAISAWRAAGWAVAARPVLGSAFWQVVEIVEVPELLQHSTQLLENLPAVDL